MKRYKLVRIVDGQYLSANTPYKPLKYVAGKVTKAAGLGVATYKALKYADKPSHIRETMVSFNEGKPIAVLQVEPIGKHIRSHCFAYKKGWVYEGGINYPAIRVIRVAKTITELVEGK